MPNIPACIIGILLIVLVVLSLAYKARGETYELLYAKHSAFVSETRAKGLEAKSRERELELAYLHTAKNLEKTRAELTSKLDITYADYERLRHNASASRERVRSLTEALQGVDCGAAEARLIGNLERLEKGISERLLKSRDRAIIALNSCIDSWTELAAQSRR